MTKPLRGFTSIEMKRRYLFPLIYILADAFSLLFINFPGIRMLISSLSIPSGWVMVTISRTIGIPTDPTYFAYFVGVGTILQMFLVGLLWELLVERIRKLSDRKGLAV